MPVSPNHPAPLYLLTEPNGYEDQVPRLRAFLSAHLDWRITYDSSVGVWRGTKLMNGGSEEHARYLLHDLLDVLDERVRPANQDASLGVLQTPASAPRRAGHARAVPGRAKATATPGRPSPLAQGW